MKLSERMFARAERMRKRGHRAYAMFLRADAQQVAQLEAIIDEIPSTIYENICERLGIEASDAN